MKTEPARVASLGVFGDRTRVVVRRSSFALRPRAPGGSEMKMSCPHAPGHVPRRRPGGVASRTASSSAAAAAAWHAHLACSVTRVRRVTGVDPAGSQAGLAFKK